MAYRAFHALPVENFQSSKGQPTNAIYGFASMIVNLIASESPTHIAVAFDVSRKTFRKELFPDYKATRSATPDEFRSQMSYLYELVTAMGIERFAIEGFEADDILATLSTEAEKEGFEVLICSGDRDSFQLVTKNITVLYPKKGVTEMNRMTPAAVKEKYGLTPTQYPDFAALRGDPSDNLPSVPGVGEKTATKWIQDFGSLQKLIEGAGQIPGKVGESLRSHVDAIILNRELTQLKHDVALETSIQDLSWAGPDMKAVDLLLEELEIKALKNKIRALAGDETTSINEAAAQVRIAVATISSTELKKKLEKRTDPIALYTESGFGSNEWSIALTPDEVYLSNEPADKWLLESAIPKWVHGAKELLWGNNINAITFDTEIAAYLINPGGRNLELSDLSERFLRVSVNVESDDLFSSFNASLSGVIMKLVPILKEEIEERELGKLLDELEMPTMLELAELEKVGIAVDLKKLESLKSHFQKEVGRETKEAHKTAGHEFNVASPKQLQVVLFDEMNLPKTKKIKTGFTTDAESLQTLFEKT